MTTIPSRLARVSQTSASLLDARRRTIQLYRDWYRAVCKHQQRSPCIPPLTYTHSLPTEFMYIGP
jgi:hypothetical protein